MSFALLGLAVLLGLALLGFDVWQSRRDDRFAPEEQTPGVSIIQRGFVRAFGGEGRRLPRIISPVAIVYGLLSFPATLAPVILSVQALQAHPIGGDGTTALLTMIVAGLSMSAGIKAIRAGGLLLLEDAESRRVVGRSILYVVGWAALVLCLVTLAQPASSAVATIMYIYTGVTVLVALLLRLAF